MAVSSTRKKIDQVFAAASKDLEAQLKVVRADIARLTAEEQELVAALGNLTADGKADPAVRVPATRQRRSAAKQAAKGKRSKRARSRRRAASKPTAERVEELRAVLADGPKSRGDLATALKVSPARVQQLLDELGSSVSSRPDPGDRRGKLWSIKGARNGASSRGRSRRDGAQRNAASAAKPRGRKASAAR